MHPSRGPRQVRAPGLPPLQERRERHPDVGQGALAEEVVPGVDWAGEDALASSLSGSSEREGEREREREGGEGCNGQAVRSSSSGFVFGLFLRHGLRT